MTAVRALIARRPAETSTAVAAAAGLLLSRLLHADADETGAIIILIGAIPTGVTWIVTLIRRR